MSDQFLTLKNPKYPETGLRLYCSGFPVVGGGMGGAPPPSKSEFWKWFFAIFSKYIASREKTSSAIESTLHKDHFKPIFRGRGCLSVTQKWKQIFDTAEKRPVPPPSKSAIWETLGPVLSNVLTNVTLTNAMKLVIWVNPYCLDCYAYWLTAHKWRPCKIWLSTF